MPFLAPRDVLDLRQLAPRRWRVLAPLTFKWGARRFQVPTGFETDLASVPRVLWPLASPAGRWARAAVLHDWLYAFAPAVVAEDRRSVHRLTRRQADRAFREALRASGAGFGRWFAWAAVRAFGWRAWNRRRARPSGRV